ncbi:hypothetical protein A9G45_07340 [Gilliamella sp. HK2]|jgi:hypothetical protein|uniref:hypothetical protein n=1 Tax=Gilliamella sp. HK2 TaxID=3120246 RepID=UPI00080E1F30|nr:hypothetical protein [Gilliamella apicola]OCG25179.1 hypothetical protein A9G46_07620 [Gilliamella apicola]OCG27992.1 hypothetical protein A9G45_07340 [Gilliamella apicola]
MRIFSCIILFIQWYIISCVLGKDDNIILSQEKITSFIVWVFFIFNCLIALIYWAIKSKKTNADGIIICLLLSIILAIPLNRNIIESNRARYLEQKHKLYDQRMSETLTPFYKGSGTEDEKRIQRLREEFVDKYTEPGLKFSNDKDRERLLCPQKTHSWVTNDQQYIILTCQYPDNSLAHYAYATYKENGSPVTYLSEQNYFEEKEVLPFPYLHLITEDDYSKIYTDPIDGTRYGKYYDKLYVIPTVDKNENDLKSHINDSVIEFQKQHITQFPNDKVIKLAYYLLASNQCQTVDNVGLFGDDRLIIKCNQKSFAVNYQKLYQSVPEPSSVIPLEVFGNNQENEQQDCLTCACSKTGQAKVEYAPDFDSSRLRKMIAKQCENDNQWPYNKCVGFYYESLLKTNFGNYLRVSIVHVKNDTLVAQCVVEVTDQKFTALQKQTKLKTDGTPRNTLKN